MLLWNSTNRRNQIPTNQRLKAYWNDLPLLVLSDAPEKCTKSAWLRDRDPVGVCRGASRFPQRSGSNRSLRKKEEEKKISKPWSYFQPSFNLIRTENKKRKRKVRREQQTNQRCGSDRRTHYPDASWFSRRKVEEAPFLFSRPLPKKLNELHFLTSTNQVQIS